MGKSNDTIRVLREGEGKTMRLIDADALIKRMNEDCLTCIDYYEKPDACMKCKFTKVEKAINETPTVSQAEEKDDE